MPLDVFHRTLELELEHDLGRVGRFGDGVLVGSVEMGIGLDLDLVVVLGLAEGSFPATVRDDSLLPDHERAPRRRRAAAARPTASSASTASSSPPSPARAASCSCVPRGDLRRSVERVPSRWVLDLCIAPRRARIAGGRPTCSAAGEPWVRTWRRFDAGLRQLDVPGHRAGAPAPRPARAPAATSPPPTTPRTAARRRRSIAARRSDRFTRFDGNLAGLPVPSPVDRITSPTRLERWADCPHRHLVEDLLARRAGREPRGQPHDHAARQGQPRARGARAVPARRCSTGRRPSGPQPGEPWTADDRGRLLRDRRGALRPVRGAGARRAGRSSGRRDRRRILADLDATLADDSAHRVAHAHRAAGRRARLRVHRRLDRRGGGRAARRPHLRVRGRIDRVDVAADGTVHVVDYKTGCYHAGLPATCSADDPVGGGTKLQLAVYGLAGRLAATGRRRAPVHAEYWFVTHARASSTAAATTSPTTCSSARVEVLDDHRRAASRAACSRPTPPALSHLLPDRVPRVRPRRPRHRRAAQAVGPQAPRPGPGRAYAELAEPLDEAGAGDDRRCAARPGRPRPHRRRPRRHAVRRGRRRLGQDHRARRPGRRPRHLRRRSSSRNLAAITFTEKAGAELRDRVRRALQERGRRRRRPRGASACRAALAQLDGAAIGTLHSFAQRLLSEHPVEARLPPKVEVLDEVVLGGGVRPALDARPRRAPRRPRRSSARSSCSTPPASTRASCARSPSPSSARWDLVEDLVPERVPRAAAPSPTSSPKLHDELGALAPLAGECIDPTDKLLRAGRTSSPRYAERAARARRRRARPPRRAARPALPELPRRTPARPPSWRGCKDAGPRAARRRRATPSTTSAAACSTAAPTASAPALRRHTLDAADQRRARRARSSSTTCSCWPARVLRDPAQGPVVRAAPPRALPAAAARRVPGHRPDPDRARRAHRRRRSRRRPTRPRWADVDVAPGPPVRGRRPQAVDLPVPPRRHLHVPGRRASASRPRRRRRGAARPTSAPCAPVIDWVNATFRTAARGGARRRRPRPLAARYIDLARHRGAGRRSARRSRSSARAPHPRRHRRRRASARAESRDVAARRSPRAARRGLVGATTATTAGARAGSATSRSSCPPAPRCRSSRTPSRRPASPTAPSPARSSTPPGRSATC